MLSVHQHHLAGPLLAVALALAVLPAPPAAAQGSTPAARAEARRLLREGSKAFAQGNHIGALEKFERALHIFPSARIQYNIGQALRELHRPVEAVEAFETFLARAERVSASERRETAAALKELDPSVARLTLTTSVPEVEITIDGRTRGKTPLPGHLVLSPGSHEVILGRAGYKPLRETVVLAGGEQKRARFVMVENDLAVAAVPPAPAPVIAAPPPPRSTVPGSGGSGVIAVPVPGPSMLETPPTDLASERAAGAGWRSQTVVGVALLAASAACAVGAGALMARSWSRYNQAKDSCTSSGSCEADADAVDSQVLWSKLLVGAAALTGVGGAATLLVIPRSGRPGDVAAGGFLLSGRGTF